MRRATIDIGSNSILLLAGIFTGEVFEEELNESRITSLGKNLDETGNFDSESMDNSYQALREYQELLITRNYNINEVIVTATEASRIAKNAPDFYQKIQHDLNFKVKVISSEGEAFYTALGVASSLESSVAGEVVIMDIGGASTELIKVKLKPEFKIEATISLPIGSVRATDWLKEDQFEKRWNDLSGNYPLGSFSTERLICVAGSMTALGAIYFQQQEFDAEKLEGKIISKNNFMSFLNSLSSMTVDRLIQDYPFLGKRVHSLKGGSLVANSFVKLVVEKEIMISTRGLRYGTLFAGEINGSYIIE